MVELFAALGFAEGPRLRSKSRFRLSPGRKLPTPAELNGPSGPGPLVRDFHPLRRITASVGRANEVIPCRPVSTGPVRHRIEHRDYSHVLSNIAQGTQARITPMS